MSERPKAIINAMCDGYRRQTEEAIKSGRFKLIKKEEQYMFSCAPTIYFVTGVEFDEVPPQCMLPVYRWALEGETKGLHLDTPVMKVLDLKDAKKTLDDLHDNERKLSRARYELKEVQGNINIYRIDLAELEEAIHQTKIRACNLGIK